MNIHPLFVHFPIALLIVYALLELARLTPAKKWQHLVAVKNICLFLGTATALVTLPTGEAAEHALSSAGSTIHDLVETHSLWATATTWYFVVISLAQAATWFEGSRMSQHQRWQRLNSVLQKLHPLTAFLTKPMIAAILALLGLVAMTVVGALGGAIVYGPDTDPIVAFVYRLVIGN